MRVRASAVPPLGNAGLADAAVALLHGAAAAMVHGVKRAVVMLLIGCSPIVAERLEPSSLEVVALPAAQTRPSYAERVEGQPRPDAPHDVVAVKTGRGRARVNWSAANGHGLSHLVRAEPGGLVTEVTGREADFDALATPMKHTFFVRARTVVGLGAEVASNEVVVADVPAAPVDVRAAPARDSAYVTWIPPENGGAPILEYELFVQATGAVTRVPGNQSAARVSGLTTGQSHTVLVRATNLAGAGASTAATLTASCVRGFVNPPMANIESDSRSAGLVDLNGDGTLDVWANDGHRGLNLIYFTERGTIARVEATGIPLTSYVAAADLDEDGTVDVITGAGHNLDVHLAKGGAQRFNTTRLLAGSSAVSALAADLNGDHHVDIVAAYELTTRVYLGHSDGSFTELFTPPVGGSAAGDFDGDGKASLVGGRSPDGLSLFDMVDGGFVETRFSVGRPLSGIFVADVERDGHDDLILSFSDGTEIWHSVAGTLQPLKAIAGFRAALVSDATGDGLVDLFDRAGALLTNVGDAGFAVTTSLALNEFWEVVGVADLDRDGAPDAVIATEDGVGVALGRFRERALLPGPFVNLTRPFGAAIADFDSDGRPDLAEIADHAPETLRLWLSLDNDGGWSSTTTVTQYHALASGLDVGDLNGDGLPDLVLSKDTGAEVFMNDAGALAFDRSLAGYRAIVGDFDGDGVGDVFVAGQLHRGGPAGLAPGVQVGGPTVALNSMISSADLIGDHAAELIGYDGVWSLTDAGFQRGPLVQVTKVADLNRDGLADGIFLGTGSDPVYSSPNAWLQTSDGGFELRACVPPPPPATTYDLIAGSFADLDADGDFDFVGIDRFGWATLVVFWNDGNGGFTTMNRYRSGYGRTNVATVDVDGDGAAEFIATAVYGQPVFHPNVCVE